MTFLTFGLKEKRDILKMENRHLQSHSCLLMEGFVNH